MVPQGFGGREQPEPGRGQRPAVVAVEAEGEAERIVQGQGVAIPQGGEGEARQAAASLLTADRPCEGGRTGYERVPVLHLQDAVGHQAPDRPGGGFAEGGRHVGRQRPRLAQGKEEQGRLAVHGLEA